MTANAPTWSATPAVQRRREVGQRQVRPAVGPGHLLAQRVQPGQLRPSAPRRPRARCRRRASSRPARSRPTPSARSRPSSTTRREHGLGVVEEVARGGAHLGVVQDVRVAPAQLPGGEERRPVDALDELGERDSRPGCARPGRWAAAARAGRRPVDAQPAGARLGQRDAARRARRAPRGCAAPRRTRRGVPPRTRRASPGPAARRRRPPRATRRRRGRRARCRPARAAPRCAPEVVAPPMSSGMREALRAPSRVATMRISSSEGVMSPDRPMRSAPSAARRLEDARPGHHDAQVDDLVVVAAEHDAHDVLADVVDVALDRGHDDLAGRAPPGPCRAASPLARAARSASM